MVCHYFPVNKKKNLYKKQSKDLTDLASLNKMNKFIAFTFASAIFSSAALPPFLGFLAKLSIFSNVLTTKTSLSILFLALLSVISTFFYIRIAKVAFFESKVSGRLYLPITSGHSLVFSFLSFLLMILIAFISLIYKHISLITFSL